MNQKTFKNGFVYKIAYNPAVRSGLEKDNTDIQYNCPNCGCELWIYHNKTGTGKLPEGRLKFKCKGCGQFFICGDRDVTKVLGL